MNVKKYNILHYFKENSLKFFLIRFPWHENYNDSLLYEKPDSINHTHCNDSWAHYISRLGTLQVDN